MYILKRELNTIAVLPGDGVGPEVVEQAIKVLDTIKIKYKHNWTYAYADIGAVAIDRHGDPFPTSTYDTCYDADAILMGAIGHPRYDNDTTAKIRPEQGLLALRKSLGLYANIRPIRLHDKLRDSSPIKKEILKDVDFVVFRELTSGIYFGDKERTDAYATDVCKYTREEVKRIARKAYEMARTRRSKITLIDKANVLETSRLWRAVVQEMSEEYSDVTTEYLFVDNAAMQMIINPRQFDVILCSNMFGDIISDEASVLVGSLGLLPSSSRGNKHALYEPIHGSFPQAANKDIANPVATILSVEMMLRDFGYIQEADDIKQAFDTCIDEGIATVDVPTPHNCSCSQMGDLICALIDEGNESVIWNKCKAGLTRIF